VDACDSFCCEEADETQEADEPKEKRPDYSIHSIAYVLALNGQPFKTFTRDY